MYYAEEVVQRLKQSEEIVIYGARIVAKEVANCLLGAPYQFAIKCFMVSDMAGNPESIMGIPVITVKEGREKYQNALILVAVMEKYMDEISYTLSQNGFQNIIFLGFESNLWSALRGNYYCELRKCQNKSYITLEEELQKVSVSDDKDTSEVHIYMAKCHVDKPLSIDFSKYNWEIPIQVGASLTDQRITDICDNQGENISEKNREYCELTALYWIWKNDHSKYAGLCHYRRHFLLTDELLKRLASSDIDVVLTIPILNFPSVRDAYVHDHIEKDWDIMLEAIEKLQPGYRETAEEIQNGVFYCGYNMFIARKEILNAYCEWLFPILAYCEKKCGVKEDSYQNRYIGFLAERLLTIYFMHHESKYKIAYANKEFCK